MLLIHRKTYTQSPTYEYTLISYRDFDDDIYDHKSGVAHRSPFTSIGPLFLHLQPHFAIYHCARKIFKSGNPHPSSVAEMFNTDTHILLLSIYHAWNTIKPTEAFFSTQNNRRLGTKISSTPTTTNDGKHARDNGLGSEDWQYDVDSWLKSTSHGEWEIQVDSKPTDTTHISGEKACLVCMEKFDYKWPFGSGGDERMDDEPLATTRLHQLEQSGIEVD